MQSHGGTETVEEATAATADSATTWARSASSCPMTCSQQVGWARLVVDISVKSGAAKLDTHGTT